MPSVTIDKTLTFDFPEGWDYAKFDEWTFYRKHFSKMANGIAEQPERHSKLFPLSFDKADLQNKLKAQLKPVDPHALVVNKNTIPTSIQWTVR